MREGREVGDISSTTAAEIELSHKYKQLIL